LFKRWHGRGRLPDDSKGHRASSSPRGEGGRAGPPSSERSADAYSARASDLTYSRMQCTRPDSAREPSRLPGGPIFRVAPRFSIGQFGIVRRVHAIDISRRIEARLAKIQASEVPRAVAAARSTAAALGLTTDDAILLHDSNKLTLRLLPCDVLARVAPAAHQVAQFEVELAQRLAETESPVAVLEPRVEPRVYQQNGFVVTLWTYHESGTPRALSPPDYATALERLHAGMRTLDVTTPHFTDRVAEAQRLVGSRDHTPALTDADREFLSNTLRRLRRAIGDRGATEQLLHGEPHPGNVLSTKNGLRFIDLETCCRGPVEFDLAHVSEEVSERYSDADRELLRECRILVLAMVAAWRWDPGDQLPNGQRAARELLSALREGPPWPALDVVMRRRGGP
jgi:aminoglycoside phosphotransferase (APT) family kinase protein